MLHNKLHAPKMIAFFNLSKFYLSYSFRLETFGRFGFKSLGNLLCLMFSQCNWACLLVKIIFI